MRAITLILGGFVLLTIISAFDYFLTGRKLIGEIPIKSRDLLAFYFVRSFAEFLCFAMGIIIGGKLI